MKTRFKDIDFETQCKEELDEFFNDRHKTAPKRVDNAPVKRVELHAHTQMSEMDGLVSARDLIERAAEWGYNAIAITDSDVVQAFPEAYRESKGKNIKVIYGADVKLRKSGRDYAATVLVKNPDGLKNLYKLISLSHTEYLCEKTETPYMPIEVIAAHRVGLLIGSGCSGGDVYNAIHRGDPEEEICGIAKFYDYLELDVTEDESANTVIARIGETLDKPVVAVGDSRYLDPEDKAAHRILRKSRGHEYSDNRANYHFRTTGDMLTELVYLGKDKAYEVVVTNSNLIADMIEEMPPIPEGYFPPAIDGADKEIMQICNARAKEIYGETLPDNVKEILDYELRNCN